MIKVFVVIGIKGIKPTVDSVYRFRSKANTRKFDLISEGEYQTVEIVEKELE